jgi:tetratricopeptide (TPR) repeat protein
MRAGDNAVARHADQEAIEHFTKALGQLATLPDKPERTERELELLVKIATPLMSTHGYAAAEVERVFLRAHALLRQVEPGPPLFPLLRGMASFYQVRAQHEAAHSVGEELLILSKGSDDPVALVQAHYGHGVTLYNGGYLQPSRPYLEEGLRLYDPETHPTHVSVYGGYDPGVGCTAWLAWVHFQQGRADRAVAMANDAVALADRLAHPFTRDIARIAAAMVHLSRGESGPALDLVAQAAAISSREGFAYALATGAALTGWALLTQGKPDEALRRIDDALEGFRRTGAAAGRPAVLGSKAIALAMLGRHDEAMPLLDDAIAEAERSGQRLHLGQLHVTRGDLLGGAEEGEPCYRRGLEAARDVGAAMLALRAGTRLARVWMQQGRTAEAHALVEPLVAAIEEGFQLHDVREARALLARQ